MSPPPVFDGSGPVDRLVELQIFLAIVELGNLARAARRLDRSGRAVSRALARLEGRMGVVLMDRSTRRCQPTDAGRRLAREARTLLDNYGAAIALTSASDGVEDA